jgi:hypothetical protein
VSLVLVRPATACSLSLLTSPQQSQCFAWV